MARKPKDPTVLHGHHVVTGSELRAAFAEDDELENPARMRRRILHGVVLVLLVALVTAAVVVALQIRDGQIKLPTAERSQAAATVCPQATYDYTPHAKIKVNVYNSTSRPGLARTVAGELRARKFTVGAVGNTSSGFRGVALVVSGAAGQSGAFSVQRNLPGSDYVQDARNDASVDVILTGDFKALAKPALVDQTPGKLSCPRETRRVVEDPAAPVVPTVVPASPNP
ncbi:LytR C-terminal domain-containing protein [Arthrobacter sp. Hor0625]|uniref:LytR C-terminal domain-containing protein n=1 Tax=Arthrobacter sp. Hor0625 TaxID=3457358 RepID=UPI00403E4B16